MWTPSGVGPGFVDLQVNGALGIDFADPDLSAASARHAIAHVLGNGTAAFLPTLVSAPPDVYRRNLAILGQLVRDPALEGRVAGIHLEGPFIAPDQRVLGAHRREHVLRADVAMLENLQDWAGGAVRLLTIAAEIDGAAVLTAAARRLGMAVSVGHSWATANDLARVRDAGASALTHFGNGIAQTLPRHDNPLVAGLATDGLDYMMILDGHHVTRDLVRAVMRAAGPGSIILTSDAAPVAGLAPGQYRVFEQGVEVTPDGRIWNPVEQHLAGSAACLLDCVNQALDWGLFDRQTVLRAAFDAPLALAGLVAGPWVETARVAHDAARGRFALMGHRA